jgi:hypothetical protein
MILSPWGSQIRITSLPSLPSLLLARPTLEPMRGHQAGKSILAGSLVSIRKILMHAGVPMAASRKNLGPSSLEPIHA